jgi:hypothetical protein
MKTNKHKANLAQYSKKCAGLGLFAMLCAAPSVGFWGAMVCVIYFFLVPYFWHIHLSRKRKLYPLFVELVELRIRVRRQRAEIRRLNRCLATGKASLPPVARNGTQAIKTPPWAE